LTFTDPEITVRRKTLFLLNTLLLPTTSTSTSSSSEVPSNLQTPNSPPEGQQNPIYPNSHAAHLYNPSRASTSQLTLDAFREHGITGAVVDVLTNPLPCGEDGEDEGGDVEVEENGVRLVFSSRLRCFVIDGYCRLLHTYAVICSETLSVSEKKELKTWLEQGKEKEKGDEKVLAERLGMDVDELSALIGKMV
jgi:hsp70-interacting protein